MGTRNEQYGQAEFHPGFGPAEVTWDDGTVSIYPGADLKVMGKIQPVTAEP